MFDELKYDKDSGKVYRNGKEVGWTDVHGYRRFNFNGKRYYTHRVAWYLYYGKWPDKYIDHKNQDKTDNRIDNLRDVNASANLRNQKKIKGYYKQGKKWRVTYSKNNKSYHVGTFTSEKEAQMAYIEATKGLV